MRDATHRQGLHRGPGAWARFLIGAVLLTGVVLMLMQGYVPDGVAGEVFRHNMRHGIDATPLFYTEVESLAPGG
jgi:hypothetical protein